jgi:dihydroxyacetone kinase-like protein
MGGLTVTDAVTLDDLLSWLGSFTDAVHEHMGYLTELDSAIGDADHGANLTRGMDAVMAAVAGPDAGRPDDAGSLLTKVGMTLVTSVGGASGPLYGTFFLRLGTTAGAVRELDGPALLQALQAGLEGIVTRGRAEPGDKTMYDALAPAVAALSAGLEEGESLATSVRRAATAAAEGRDATSDMLALKGRASYLGERSVGHIDPGSASAALMLSALADAVG